MKSVPTTRQGGAKAVKGNATRNMYGMSERSATLNGTEKIPVKTPRGK